MRRVTENEYLDEVEKERSETDRAHARIEEEEEKVRRVAEEKYQEEVWLEKGHAESDISKAREQVAQQLHEKVERETKSAQ